MYLSFYGFQERPFAATPDPRFLYLTPGHREALAHLVYGVREHTGFLVLTGEVGTGKTSLLRALLERLDGNAAVAFLVNSSLSFDGILEYALAELGVPTPGASRAQRLIALQGLLIDRSRAGQSILLILDEAHRLTRSTLDHIRQLSNLETPTRTRLQVLLVGQPELKAKLALPALRQLRQRVTLRAVLPPLSSREVGKYVRRRLQIAGARDSALFTERAITHIAVYSGGIPRIVNTVCEHCLLIGYADQRQDLDVDVVKRAVRYLEGRTGPQKALSGAGRHWWLPSRRFAWAALTPMLLGLMALPVLRRDTFDSVSHVIAPLVTTLVQSARELLGP
jgi:general secretion pathway protein A